MQCKQGIRTKPGKPKFLRYHRKVCAINESFWEYITQVCDVCR